MVGNVILKEDAFKCEYSCNGFSSFASLCCADVPLSRDRLTLAFYKLLSTSYLLTHSVAVVFPFLFFPS